MLVLAYQINKELLDKYLQFTEMCTSWKYEDGVGKTDIVEKNYYIFTSICDSYCQQGHESSKTKSASFFKLGVPTNTGQPV